MEEEDMVLITLKCLPCAYRHFIETLNITFMNVDLKFDELCSELLQQDRWKKQFGNSSETKGFEHAFAAKLKGKGKWAKRKGQSSGEDVTKDQKTINITVARRAI
jgi:hypothetical protein